MEDIFLDLEINEMDDLLLLANFLADDIDDFLDEHPITQLMESNELMDSNEDIDKSLEKLSTLRSNYRMKHKELLRSQAGYGTSAHA